MERYGDCEWHGNWTFWFCAKTEELEQSCIQRSLQCGSKLYCLYFYYLPLKKERGYVFLFTSVCLSVSLSVYPPARLLKSYKGTSIKFLE